MSLFLLNIFWQVSILALVTLGLAIIFGQLRIMNMAHGEFIMIGAYSSVISTQLELPFFMQPIICILLAVIIAVIIERFVVRHLYGKVFDSLLATWAIGILLREIVTAFFGRDYKSVSVPLPGTSSIFGTNYPTYRLFLIAMIILGFIALFLWYRKSILGTKIRAMVANPNLAMAIGIDVKKLSRNVFIFGVVITSFSGWLIAPTARVDPYMGIDYLVRSFFALVVGGLASLEGLIFGSSIIAGMQSVIALQTNLVVASVCVLIISILFLWRRPHGIINKN